MRKSDAKWLRIARAGGFVLFLLAVGCFTTLPSREIGLHFGGSRFVSVGNAALQCGWNLYRFRVDNGKEMAPGFYVLAYAPNQDWAFAWRPFRANDSRNPATRSWHMIVIPLWPLMPIGAAIAAYAHGVLVGIRRERTGECQSCGYDLRKTPVVDGNRKCPECGLASVTATAGGTPALPDAK